MRIAKVFLFFLAFSTLVYPFIMSVDYTNIKCNSNSDCPMLSACGNNNYVYYWRVCYNGYCVCNYGPGLDEPCDNFCQGVKMCHGYCVGSCGNAHCEANSCECNKYCGAECESNSDCPSNYYCDLETCTCKYSGGGGGGNPTHNVCQDGQCVTVSGSGTDECRSDSDCQPTHTECQNGKCVTVSGSGTDECQSDSDCIVTHYACVDNKCVLVSGDGVDECQKDSDCQFHKVCQGEKCSLISGPGIDECQTDADCQQSSHTECQFNSIAGNIVAKCVTVSGSGTDECQSDLDCLTQTHLDCRNLKCVRVLGPGVDLCQSDKDCSPKHTECQNFRCVLVDGFGNNQCQKDSDCWICPNCPESCSCFLNYCYGYDSNRDCCVEAGYYWNGVTCCGNDEGELTPSDCDTGEVSDDCKLCCGYENTPYNPYIMVNGVKHYLYEGDLGYGSVTYHIHLKNTKYIDFGVENIEPPDAVGWDTEFNYEITICEVV